MSTALQAEAPSRPSQTGPARWRSRALQIGVLLVPIVVFIIGAWHRRALNDDAFINLRVVREVIAGHGPVWNAGERVEAFTSPLWLWSLVAGDVVLPVRLEWIAVLGDLVLSVVGLVALMLGSALLTRPAVARHGGRRSRHQAPLAVPAGILVLAALTPMWTYAGSGLENGLCTAWIGVSLYLAARWACEERSTSFGMVLVFGLGPLVRPELGLLSVLLLAVVLLGDRTLGWLRRIALLAVGLALPVGYQIFRMGYYGMLVPNSAVAKSASSARWAAGWKYVNTSLVPYWIWIPLLALVVGAYLPLVRDRLSAGGRSDRRLLVVGAFVVGGLLVMLYITRVGGDYLHARLLLPGLTALLAPVAVVRWQRRYLAVAVVLPWAVVCTVAIRAPGDHYGFFYAKSRNPVTTDDFRFNPPHGGHPAGSLYAAYTRPGVYFDTTYLGPAPPGGPKRIVAEYAVGVTAYAFGPDTYVLDLLGLGDPFTSHLELKRRGLNSHEKPLPLPWLVARLLPDGTRYDVHTFVQGASQREPLELGITQLGDPRAPFTARVADARRALRCPAVRDLLSPYRRPLTLGRFFDNIVEAPRRTSLRIPSEPSEALRRFAKGGGC